MSECHAPETFYSTRMRRLIRFLFGPSMAERQRRIREDRAMIDAIDAYLRATEVPHDRRD